MLDNAQEALLSDWRIVFALLHRLLDLLLLPMHAPIAQVAHLPSPHAQDTLAQTQPCSEPRSEPRVLAHTLSRNLARTHSHTHTHTHPHPHGLTLTHTHSHTMTQDTVHIGGRRSKLAVAQSEAVQRMIQDAFQQYSCRLTTTQTLGDQVQFKPLYSFGGKALWTKELEDLLYEQDPELRLDVVVHSLKDMPTLLPDGFQLGAITKRVDPSDCLVMAQGSPYRTLAELPAGSVVGTSSVRRSAQLKRHFPHLQYQSVRGNIHTRLDKVDDPDSPYACLILATAGLVRMGLDYRISQRFDASTMYHAVGQGALGLEIRQGDARMQRVLAEIEDVETTACCLAERALMRTLEGGCSVPIGVQTSYSVATRTLAFSAIVIDVEGTTWVEDSTRVVLGDDWRADAMQCGNDLALRMIQGGAKKILDEINLAKLPVK